MCVSISLDLQYLGVDGGREVAEQPDVILLTGLHVHHEAGVEVPQRRGLGERLVQTHLPHCRLTAGHTEYTH